MGKALWDVLRVWFMMASTASVDPWEKGSGLTEGRWGAANVNAAPHSHTRPRTEIRKIGSERKGWNREWPRRDNLHGEYIIGALNYKWALPVWGRLLVRTSTSQGEERTLTDWQPFALGPARFPVSSMQTPYWTPFHTKIHKVDSTLNETLQMLRKSIKRVNEDAFWWQRRSSEHQPQHTTQISHHWKRSTLHMIPQYFNESRHTV